MGEEIKVIVTETYDDKIVVMILEGKDKGTEMTIELEVGHSFSNGEIVHIKKKFMN